MALSNHMPDHQTDEPPFMTFTGPTSRSDPAFDGWPGHGTAPMPWVGLVASRTTASASCEEKCHADREECRYADFRHPQRHHCLWITFAHQIESVRMKRKGRSFRLGPAQNPGTRSSSDHLEMAGARLAALGDELVADLLRLVERAETGALNRADVNEDVLRAIIGLDESKALLRIEPFDFACRHLGDLSSCEQTGGPTSVPAFEPQCLEKSPKGQTPSKP